jgi:phosphotriesterase-related protein
MSQVPTVRGPVSSAGLGPTYMHEHIFTLTADVQQNYPQEWGSEEARVADAAGKLRALAAQGIATIVDPTVVGLGRYIPRIQRVAAQVPELNIIVATGLYTYDSVPFFFRHRGPALNEVLRTEVPDPMVGMFVADVVEGIAGTGVRAGLLKCAIDAGGMTPGVERVMRAVAAAHHRTGAPVMVHTHPGSRTGLAVKRVLCDSAGVEPGRVLLAHGGDTTDCDHLAGLADAGFTLGWTGSGSMSRRRSRLGRTRWWRCAGAGMRGAWCCRRTRRATSTGSIRRSSPSWRSGTICISATRCCPTSATATSPTARSPRC